eukprot:gb/GECG01015471.1/.p1 GENE.gb/GECG01015471.1/~~gb/GECG01015471.1/.p1  ORF type:complete len:122 (+),score=8.00 gb/GECG01015471.1/:1-366(+)
MGEDSGNTHGLVRNNVDNEAIQQDLSAGNMKTLQKKYVNEQQRCISMAQRAIENSPMIQFLLTSMEKRGCALPNDFVRCIPQPNIPSYGNFHPDVNRVCPYAVCSVSVNRFHPVWNPRRCF